MTLSSLSIRAARWLAMLPLALLPAMSAQAEIRCNASMTPLNFGNVNPLASQTNATATLSYFCRNTLPLTTYNVRLCFSLGVPSGSGTAIREMEDLTSTNKLQFQLYRKAGGTEIWGSSYNPAVPGPHEVTFRLGSLGSTSGSLTLYGQVGDRQNTVPPGTYTSNYLGGDTALLVKSALVVWPFDPVPDACDNTFTRERFPFSVKATVVKNCEVTAIAADIDLGTVPASATNVAGAGSIGVTCSNTTPYNVGLRPSNESSSGYGVMRATGGNTDQVPYQLYQDAAMTRPWGNPATGGAGVSGAGTGSARSLPVYVKVPSADVQPDNYSDTVTVVVNY